MSTKATPKYWFFVGLLVGALILATSIALKPDAPANLDYDRSRLVEVMPLQESALTPEVIGFGRVRPKVIWQALAEVSGRVISRNSQLEAGQILPKGTLLLEIDPLEYELKLAQAKAELSGANAQLTRLEQNRVNLEANLELEQKRLQLAEAETDRKTALRKKGLLSESELDNQRQSQLAQQKLVQELSNQLQLLPDDRRLAQAEQKVAAAALADAERRLAQTRITMPFDGRIAVVDIELDQVVNQGLMMVEVHGIDRIEVQAQIALHDIRSLVNGTSIDWAGEFPSVDKLGLSAELILDSGSYQSQWQAQVTGIRESVDPNQATVGVILEVTQDYRDFNPALKPPLVNDMFVAAKIIAQPRDVLWAPAKAIRGDKLYLMDKQERLRILAVTELFRYQDKVAIEGEFAAGEHLVLTDVLPAIEGMLLRVEAHQ